jgi:hypothetical protein
MSDSRARTSVLHFAYDFFLAHIYQDRLATLDAFLDSQRHLLARTQSDLHKLASLREHALADPQRFIENLNEEVGVRLPYLNSLDMLPRSSITQPSS